SSDSARRYGAPRGGLATTTHGTATGGGAQRDVDGAVCSTPGGIDGAGRAGGGGATSVGVGVDSLAGAATGEVIAAWIAGCAAAVGIDGSSPGGSIAAVSSLASASTPDSRCLGSNATALASSSITIGGTATGRSGAPSVSRTS